MNDAAKKTEGSVLDILTHAGLLVPEVLLPDASLCDYGKWAVVACDQFTSQPSYWREAEAFLGDSPSTLRLILPESDLGNRLSERVAAIHKNMRDYLTAGIFLPPTRGFILVERSFSGDRGDTRWGLVAAIDLECYDFEPGNTSLVRATEATVHDRLPPRIDIRRGAALELPHVMVLMDDPDRLLIEPLAKRAQNGCYKKLYGVDLMAGGGHVNGYLVDSDGLLGICDALNTLLIRSYKSSDTPMLFAVGDGNHSLAAAKVYWNELKNTLTAPDMETHPARFALVELVNLHAGSIVFEPIHRALYNVPIDAVFDAAESYFEPNGFCVISDRKPDIAPRDAFFYPVLYGDNKQKYLCVRVPNSALPVAELSAFIDYLCAKYSVAKIDYIHGMDELTRLSREENCVCFQLPSIDKNSLFKAITQNGVLPRKAFSMGEARDKRYYIEARKIE